MSPEFYAIIGSALLIHLVIVLCTLVMVISLEERPRRNKRMKERRDRQFAEVNQRRDQPV